MGFETAALDAHLDFERFARFYINPFKIHNTLCPKISDCTITVFQIGWIL